MRRRKTVCNRISIVVLAILFPWQLPVVASVLITGLFAIFHGHAHGSEMPVTASGLAHGVGFLFATALLHGCGVAIGLIPRKLGREPRVRFAGAAVIVCGMYLCFA